MATNLPEPALNAPRSSSEQLRLLVDTVQDYAIFLLDADGRVASWNQGAERIKGYAAEEIVGRHFSCFYLAEARERGLPERVLAEAREHGRAEQEGWRLRKDGSRFWADVVITALRGPDGVLEGFGKVTRDLTTRREHLWLGTQYAIIEALAHAETLESVSGRILQSLGEALGWPFAALWLLEHEAADAALRCADVWHAPQAGLARFAEESRACRFVRGEGLPGTALEQGLPWWVADLGAAPELPRSAAARACGVRTAFGFPLVSQGRCLGVIECAGQRERERDDEVLRYLSSVGTQMGHFIERLEARRALVRSEARLATTLRSIGDAVISTDARGQVDFMNAVAEQLTGWTEGEARGVHIDHVFPIVNEQSRQTVESPVGRVLRDGHVVGLANHTILLARDGREIPIDDSGAPIRGGDSPLDGVVLVFRDVTERRRAERELERLLEREQRARAEAERANERLLFLAEASRVLSASLDPEVTLASAVRLLTRRLADWASLHVLQPDGQLRTLTVAHVDPEKVALAEELGRRYPPDAGAPRGAAAVIRTGRSELYPQIPAELLQAAARDEEHLRILRELGLRSAMVVPLMARARPVGAITLVQAESGRAYDEVDLAFAEELGRRAGAAVENARLYRDVADKQSLLEAVLAQLPAGVMLAEAPSGRITFSNQQAVEIYGGVLGTEAVEVGAGVFRAWHADGRALAPEELPLSRAVRGELVHDEEVVFQRADGTKGVVRANAAPIRDARGEIIAGVTAYHDISEVRALEQEQARLHASEAQARAEAEAQRARLHELFMQAPVAIAVFRGAEHEIDLANEAFEILFGRRPLVGRRLREVSAEAVGSGLAGIIDRVYQSGAGFEGREYSARFAGEGGASEERLFNFVAQATRDHRGRIDGVLLMGVEVTEQVQARRRVEAAREAVARSEARFRRLYESGIIGVLFFTTDGGITDANDAFLAMLGHSREDLVAGRVRWRDLTPPEHAAADARAIDELRRTGRSTPFEKAYVRKDGSRVPVLIGAALWEGSSTEGVAWVLDVTDRKRVEAERDQLLASEKRAREEAELANRAKDDFLATVSHELRTPLNAILGYASLLRSGKLAEAAVGRALETIERNAKLQASLIEDLLDISRIITGKLRLTMQKVDLPSVVNAAVDALRPEADARAVRIEVDADASVAHVSGDPARLQQITWNLVSNAIKFSAQGGRVQVSVARAGSQIELMVVDEGQGIEPEVLPHVFERFRQADSSSTRAHGGLGLGLAIVRHLVELHHGTVSAASPGRGQGASFRVRLPLAAVVRPERDPAAPRTVAEEISLLGLRVLVVDDEPDARELLATVLRERGAVVQSAASVAEAREAIEAQAPELLVSDVGMPGEDGYALIRWLRARPPAAGGKLPAVALTAYAGPENRSRILWEGFQAHLAKPVEPDELVLVAAAMAGRTGAR